MPNFMIYYPKDAETVMQQAREKARRSRIPLSRLVVRLLSDWVYNRLSAHYDSPQAYGVTREWVAKKHWLNGPVSETGPKSETDKTDNHHISL